MHDGRQAAGAAAGRLKPSTASTASTAPRGQDHMRGARPRHGPPPGRPRGACSRRSAPRCSSRAPRAILNATAPASGDLANVVRRGRPVHRRRGRADDVDARRDRGHVRRDEDRRPGPAAAALGNSSVVWAIDRTYPLGVVPLTAALTVNTNMSPAGVAAAVKQAKDDESKLNLLGTALPIGLVVAAVALLGGAAGLVAPRLGRPDAGRGIGDGRVRCRGHPVRTAAPAVDPEPRGPCRGPARIGLRLPSGQADSRSVRHSAGGARLGLGGQDQDIE